MTDTARTPNSNDQPEPVAFDERTRRVLELRKQVREGTYRMDAGEVAEAMLREWALAGDLSDEVAPPAPRLQTAAERFQAAAERFIVGRTSSRTSEETTPISSAG